MKFIYQIDFVNQETEVSMNTKKFLSSIILMAVLVATFASSTPAFAAAACDTGVIVAVLLPPVPRGALLLFECVPVLRRALCLREKRGECIVLA